MKTIEVTIKLDPINDLIPVCPNCHAMLHRRNPSLMVEELRNAIMEIYYSNKYGNK